MGRSSRDVRSSDTGVSSAAAAMNFGEARGFVDILEIRAPAMHHRASHFSNVTTQDIVLFSSLENSQPMHHLPSLSRAATQSLCRHSATCNPDINSLHPESNFRHPSQSIIFATEDRYHDHHPQGVLERSLVVVQSNFSSRRCPLDPSTSPLSGIKGILHQHHARIH